MPSYLRGEAPVKTHRRPGLTSINALCVSVVVGVGIPGFGHQINKPSTAHLFPHRRRKPPACERGAGGNGGTGGWEGCEIGFEALRHMQQQKLLMQEMGGKMRSAHVIALMRVLEDLKYNHITTICKVTYGLH